MLLASVLIRFYKSFNYDYLRKNHPKGQPLPWEMIGDAWFPFVEIEIDEKITTVVGANESGKSQLLSAIEKGLSGIAIGPRDFCRYSRFFTVEQGKMRWPDFGFRWSKLSLAEKEAVRALCGAPATTAFDNFIIIRSNISHLSVWIQTLDGFKEFPIKPEAAASIGKLIPAVFTINPRIALPDSVPISWLVNESMPLLRADRFKIMEGFESSLATFKDESTVKEAAAKISSTFRGISGVKKPDSDALAEYQLARDLLFKVANIDPQAVSDLQASIRAGDSGLKKAFEQQINTQLAAALNFPKWWVQDRDFRLEVTAEDYELEFTISDRTQTHYSFDERSNGLKHFLSYYIQYLAHNRSADKPEILLMDEPDAFLSSQGQQDLLKIFSAFSSPEIMGHVVQVVYVTHSPFLIDKNHARRIRVVEKGADDEGTRVVHDVSKNHYEPLRSAFGAFVGETTFIGNCNLMVEGVSDQIMLAGATTRLIARDYSVLSTLDLNRITVVPAGSASHIPYLVYLARGRDIEQPAVIVLLDSDKSGMDARKQLKRGGAYGKQLLAPEYITMIGDLAIGGDGLKVFSDRKIRELEDIVPLSIAVAGAKKFIGEITGEPLEEFSAFTVESVIEKWTNEVGLYDALEGAWDSCKTVDCHLDKIGFARAINELLIQHKPGELPAQDVIDYDHNFGLLLAKLSMTQRNAERQNSAQRVSYRVGRAIKGFLRDHRASARKQDALILFEEIEAALDDSREAEEVITGIRKIKRDFALSVREGEPIVNYDAFSKTLEAVRYSPRVATQQEDDLQETSASIDERTSPDVPSLAVMINPAVVEDSLNRGAVKSPAPDSN